MDRPNDIDRRIVVWSKKEAETRSLQSEYIVISINDTPIWKKPNSSTWANVKEGYRAILRLNFDDIIDDKNSEFLKSITPEQSESIVRFWWKWHNKCDQIMIHCTAGMSRSAGAAAALSVLEDIPDDAIYKHCFPNALVKRRILVQAYKLGFGIWD